MLLHPVHPVFVVAGDTDIAVMLIPLRKNLSGVYFVQGRWDRAGVLKSLVREMNIYNYYISTLLLLSAYKNCLGT